MDTTPPPVDGPPRPVGPRPLRIIIAGAGAAGLVFSHALQRAGIDHVVLEKGVVAPEWGASISLWGNGARILAQAGCMDALEAWAPPLQMLHVRGPDGKVFCEEPFFDMMRERNGFPCLTMERRDFLRIVHEQLPDKSFVQTGRRVVDVVDDDDGVSVTLQDGSVERGDMLIGCDGVHSTVRELMWRNANLEGGLISAEEKRSLITTYKSLVGVAKTIPGIGSRCMHWICHRGLSFLILVQADKTYFFVNWKMPQQLRWPTKAKWNDDAAAAAAASVAELPISDAAVFGELWKHRIRAHLIGLEEGIFDHWHHGRIVLVGDSVHKMTPNFALGAMCALESSTVLINEIHQMHETTLATGQRPSKAAVSAAFQRYQEQRAPRIQAAFDATALITRMQACDGPYHWFAMRCVFPATGMAPYADALGDLCSGAPKIRFLPVAYAHRPATIRWKDEPAHVPARPSLKVVQAKQRPREVLALELASLLSLVFLVFFVFGSAVDRSLSTSSLESAADLLLSRRGAVQGYSPSIFSPVAQK